MEHRPVRALAAAEMMPPHNAGETAAFADADHIDLIVGLELIDQHLIAGLEIVVAGPQRKLAQKLRALDVSLFEMAGARLVDARRFDELNQPELNGVVPVSGRRLALYYHTRSRLEQGDRNGLSVRPEDLRHPDFLA